MFDSIKNLENLLAAEPFSQARLDLLIELSLNLIKRDNQRALALADEAYLLATKLENEEYLAKSLWCIGRAQTALNQYEKSEINLRRAIEIFKKLDDQFGEAQALRSLSNVYKQRNQPQKALEHNIAALTILQLLDRKYEQAGSLINLGIIYSDLGDYTAALDYYLQSFQLAQSLTDPAEKENARTLLIPAIFLNIGDVMMSMERWEESLDYSQRALKLSKQIGNRTDENVTLLNIGEAYCCMDKHALAQPIFENAVILSRELGDRQRESRALTMLGQIQMALGNLDSTTQYFEEGLAISRASSNSREEMMALISLGNHFLQTNELTIALGWLQQALKLGVRDSLLTELLRAHELLVLLYKQQNDWQCALANHERYHEIKQRLHGEKQNKRLEALLVQHEVEKNRQIAQAQEALNDELRRTNEELDKSYRQNQELLKQVRHQAQHDSLTGLPNRSLFEDRLQHAVSTAIRLQKNFAVMFLDLDGFKIVNDTLGHDAGDELLVQVSQRFRAVLRESDTIARLGGDEFTVIAENLTDPEDAGIVAQKLLKALSIPFTVRGHNLSVSSSIGISLYPQDASDVFTLQKHADVAMYNVKHNGKRDMRFFSPGMNQAMMSPFCLGNNSC